jgi:alkylated DNA repair dioxygenase AlkB
MTAIACTRTELGEGAWIDRFDSLVPDHQVVMERLVAELPLARERYRIIGRDVSSPRLVSWHGDPGTGYVYSGVMHEPTPWTPELAALRARVEAATDLVLNAVLVNLYRDGNDSMGWHADAEPEVGPSPDDRWIASVSLGARRRFVLRHRKRDVRHVLELGEGDVLVMRGTVQTHYRHALPKTRRPVGPRMNLTFRHVRAASRAGHR